MDKLLALQTFAVVADTGGFSKAARQLGTATSSVTRLMDALEASLGVTLLTRTTRHVTLTDAGATYLEQVGALLSQLVEADESVADAGGEPVGTLRVSVPVTYARIVLGPHLSAFLDAYPRVSLDLAVSDAYLDLATDRIDVAVRIGMLADSSLIARELAPNYRVLCASPAYLAEHGMPAQPADLCAHRCIVLGEQPRVEWRFDEPHPAAVEVSAAFLTNDGGAARTLALEGAGIALKSIWDVGPDLAAGRLRRVLPECASSAAPSGPGMLTIGALICGPPRARGAAASASRPRARRT